VVASIFLLSSVFALSCMHKEKPAAKEQPLQKGVHTVSMSTSVAHP